jgi:hypothetical protein
MYDQLTLDGSTRQQKLYEYSIEVLQMSEPPGSTPILTAPKP